MGSGRDHVYTYTGRSKKGFVNKTAIGYKGKQNILYSVLSIYAMIYFGHQAVRRIPRAAKQYARNCDLA